MHYIYKLTVGGIPYFGYTSRDPEVRLREHIDTAYKQNWKHNSKLYPALVEMEYEYEFEVLTESDNEVAALLTEIAAIKAAPVSLNLSKGGEGATVTVKVRETNGVTQVMVVPRKKPKSSPKPKKAKRRKKYRR